jgi:hypothetical protein
MKKSNKFFPELREPSVRMVHEHRGEFPSLWSAIEFIAPKIGCVPQTLNEWVKHDEVDTGARTGTTKAERESVKATGCAGAGAVHKTARARWHTELPLGQGVAIHGHPLQPETGRGRNCPPRWAARATAMTTPWPRRSTACTRPN